MFGVGYVPPNLNVAKADSVIATLQTQLDLIQSSAPLATILTGDFNAIVSNWWHGQVSNSLGLRLSRFIDANNLTQIITEPTRITKVSSTILDLIITDVPNRCVNSGVSSPLVNCDHCQIWAEMSFSIQNSYYYKEFFNFKNVNWDLFNRAIADANWQSCYLDQEPSTCVDQWLELFYSIFKAHVPKVVKKISNRDKAWFSKEVKHLVNVKHRLHRKAKLSFRTDDWDRFKKASADCDSAIRSAKQNYNQSLYDSLANPSTCKKSWWRLTKKLMKDKEDGVTSLLKNEEGHEANCPNDISNMFNDYFSKQSNIDDQGKPVPVICSRSKSVFMLPVIESAEVDGILKNLALSKSPGIDGITNEALRKIRPSLQNQPLTVFFNYCLSNSIFPEIWKRASVIPIFKKGDLTDVSNYRPVSLLSCLSKVLERIVASHLFHYLKSNNLITENQSGFMPGDSSTFHLISFSDYITKALDNGNEVVTVFMDISKAFDRVWHAGLLAKLKAYGFDNNAVNWFKSYLSNRTQRVSFKGSLSDYMNVNAGVPQGSVLGPALFLIFINDVVDNLESRSSLFADDTALSKILSKNQVINAIESLNKDLKRIEKWARSWLVTFNPSKTKVICFSLKRERIYLPDIIFFGSKLSLVDTHVHLGVCFNSKMKWNDHIDAIALKAEKRLNLMKRLKYLVPRKTLETIYITKVRSLMEYACIIFSGASKECCDKIEQIQYHAGLIVTGALPTTSYKNVLNELSWETLAARRSFLMMASFFRIVNGDAPRYLQGIVLRYQNNDYRLNLRHATNLPVPRTRLQLYETSFCVSAVKLWNALPLALRQSNSIDVFKLSYKKTFFRSVNHSFGVGPRYSNILLARFRMGYTTLKFDLFRRNIINSPLCGCGSTNESHSHFFLHCPLFTNSRDNLFRQIYSVLNVNLHNVSENVAINTLQYDSRFTIPVQQFLLNTHRFGVRSTP